MIDKMKIAQDKKAAEAEANKNRDQKMTAVSCSYCNVYVILKLLESFVSSHNV